MAAADGLRAPVQQALASPSRAHAAGPAAAPSTADAMKPCASECGCDGARSPIGAGGPAAGVYLPGALHAAGPLGWCRLAKGHPGRARLGRARQGRAGC